MKRFALLFLVLFGGCNTPEKLLCRSWRLVDVEFDESTVNLSKEEKPLLIQQLRDSCLFTFNKNHTYSLKLPQRMEYGSWSFNKDHDTLYAQNDHTGTASKINVLSKIALDVDAYSRDGTHAKYVLAPVNK
jgi:hypothetical protein